MLTLNAAFPNQYSLLQYHNKCTRSRRALLLRCNFLITIIEQIKLLSSEFMVDRSNEIYYNNNCVFQEIITK